MRKRYVVRKFIMADSVEEALKKEKEISPDDAYIDEKWLDNNPEGEGKKIIGF